MWSFGSPKSHRPKSFAERGLLPLIAVGLLVSTIALGVPAVADEAMPHSQSSQKSGEIASLDDRFLALLEAWTAGSKASAPAAWADLEHAILKQAVGWLNVESWAEESYDAASYRRGQACIALSVRAALDRLESERLLDSERATDAVEDRIMADAALSFFFLQAYAAAKSAPPRPWLSDELWQVHRLYQDRAAHAAFVDPPADPESAKTSRDRMLRLSIAAGVLLHRLSLIEPLERSKEAFDEVVRRDPENRMALYWLGFIEQQRDRPAESAQRFERLLELDPKDAEARLRLGTAKRQLGEHDTARAAFAAVARANDAAAPIRRLAYQEWVRHAPSPEQRATILDEGLGVFPRDRGLIHLAAAESLLSGDTERVSSGITALVLSSTALPSGERTPRVVHESPRDHGLVSLGETIDQDLARAFRWLRPRLRAAIDAGGERPPRPCRDLLPPV